MRVMSLPDLFAYIGQGGRPVLPDHFSGIYQGGNVPPDRDLYSKSVGGDTPCEGHMDSGPSLVSVSFSPRSDGSTMQADQGHARSRWARLWCMERHVLVSQAR
jgi:hypothetical protein